MLGKKRLSLRLPNEPLWRMTDAVTQIAQAGVPDQVYEEVSHHFWEAEIAQLLMASVTINAWNRIAITTGLVPGQMPAMISL